ncbi:hypothetical protein [Streptomyces sp. DB-54]
MEVSTLYVLRNESVLQSIGRLVMFVGVIGVIGVIGVLVRAERLVSS